MPTFPRLASLLAILLLACLGCRSPRLPVDVAPPQAAPAAPARAGEIDAGDTSQALAGALERAQAQGWQQLHILVECRSEGRMTGVELFGGGVGIWNGERQFRLTHEELRAQLQSLRDVGFANMRSSYGGRRDPTPPERTPSRLTCRVALGLDGLTKQVVQLRGGRQSEPLRRLALSILDVCRGPGRSGVGATGLEDGLTRIARGELAPEALHLVFNRQLEGRAGAARPGWLLRLDGRHVTVKPPTTPHPKEPYELGDIEFTALARLMRGAHLGDLPINLYAEHYTDLIVRVLDHEKQIIARQFAGMTATTHGDDQGHFDRVVRAIEELRESLIDRARQCADSP